MISIVAAIGKNRELGKDNKLLWHIPEDLKRFRDITSGHPIIMGRKTFESIGRPLPKRLNIVVTRDVSYKTEGAVVAHSLDEAIKLAEKAEGGGDIMIIGGGQIFTQALPIVDRLYLTIVDKEFDADAFFPEYKDVFDTVIEEKEGTNGELPYKYVTLARNMI